MAKKRENTDNNEQVRFKVRDEPVDEAEDGAPDEVASREVLLKLARSMERQLLSDKGPKFTLGDYFKILQLIKETEEDTPRRITVQWVDPAWPPKPEDD